jgi:hypothetical protein
LNNSAQDYNLNIAIATDGNHLVDVRVVDLAGNVSDLNNVIALLDVNAPTVTVTSVLKTTEAATLSIEVSEPVTCRYARGTDSNYNAMNADVNSVLTWGALSTSMPQITGLDSGTSYTYTVTCRDNNNHDGNVSVTFTTTSLARLTYHSVGGGSGSSNTTVETVSSVSEVFTPAVNEIADILQGSGLTSAEVAAYVEAARTGGIQIERTLEVVKTTRGSSSTYESTFTLTIKNTSGKDLKSVYVIETVPKSIASNASLINSVYEFRVLAADPVLEFSIPLVKAGELVSVTYSVDESVSMTEFDSMVSPIAKFAQTTVPPVTKPVVDDNKPVVPDTTPEVPEVGNNNTQPVKETPVDYTLLTVILVVAVIVIAGYFLINKSKKNSRL